MAYAVSLVSRGTSRPSGTGRTAYALGGLDVEELHVTRVLLDEGAPRLDVLTHEDGEDLVRLGGVVERDLQQRAGALVHRRLAELLVVHLAESLVALDRVVLRQAPALALTEHLEAVALAVAVGELVVDTATPTEA